MSSQTLRLYTRRQHSATEIAMSPSPLAEGGVLPRSSFDEAFCHLTVLLRCFDSLEQDTELPVYRTIRNPRALKVNVRVVTSPSDLHDIYHAAVAREG